MADMADKSERLLREAEYEMRRSFPDAEGRPPKRARQEGEPEVEEVGRFDYSAVQELGTGCGITGFLLTCDFRREKSATKEASKLLSAYLQRRLSQQLSHEAAVSNVEENVAAGAEASAPGEGGAAGQVNKAGGDTTRNSAALSRPLLSIIKLGCKGLVMLKLSGEAAAAYAEQRQLQEGQKGAQVAEEEATVEAGADANAGADIPTPQQRQQQLQRPTPAAQLVQAAAAALLADVDSGKVKRLEYCQRAIPFHTTCQLELAALQGAAARMAGMVADAANAEAAAAGENANRSAGGEAEEATGAAASRSVPIAFGVSYKQRLSAECGSKSAPTAAAPSVAGSSSIREVGFAEGGGTASESATAGAAGAAGAAAEGAAGLGRMEVIHAVAGAFERALRKEHGRQAKVDLKAPNWVVLVEELPVAGGSYVALAVLPAAMCAVKPRLGVRPVGKAKPS